MKTNNQLTRFVFSKFVFILLISNLAFAQNNKELEEMANKDQQARFSKNIDWKKLSNEDEARRIRVNELWNEKKIITAKDYFNAGIIYQHGNDTLASAKAVKSFKIAIDKDSTLNRWWYAAAVDRDLMRRNKPQIYGTQYVKNKTTHNKWALYEMDASKISDTERKYYKVGSIKELKEKERLMNLKNLRDLWSDQDINTLIDLIKIEFQKGITSEYNVTENEINSLGYQFFHKNQLEKALKIFELNTVLYPKAFNTHDSYGECLLKMGSTSKALAAYRMSLKLNPNNTNAKKIIDTYQQK